VFHAAGLRPRPLEPPIVTDGTKLPSPEQPSDHHALVAEFAWARC